MKTVHFTIPLIIAGLFFPAHCLMAQQRAANDDVQAIVDKLKQLSERARDERSADRWLLNAMDDLIRDYEWPWRVELVHEDFSDGDFTRDPVWQVRSGDYWLDRALGLRSRISTRPPPQQTVPQKREEQDMGQVLLEGLLRGVMESQDNERKPETPVNNTDAEIILPLVISNAFAIKLELSIHNAPGESGRLLFGLSQEQSGSGYLLVVKTGDFPAIELVRIRDGSSAVIENIILQNALPIGQVHTLEWRRDDYGLMQLRLNGETLANTSDRAFRGPFQRFNIVNAGGDYAVRRVTIHGD